MAHYNKGIHTKKGIVNTSRKLFYVKGYQNVTIREIAEQSDVNLGLINYYFKGKADIGMTVYKDIREAFNKMIAEYIPGRDGVYYFLIGSAVELILCIKNEAYGLFYLQMCIQKIFKEEINSIILDTLLKYSDEHRRGNNAVLSTLSIMATKPAIIEYAFGNPGQIDLEGYLKYYLEAQLYQFGIDTSKAEDLLQELGKYHIDVAESFTPIMVKIPS